MCGRFAQIDPITAVTKTFFIDEITADVLPSYNVAPGQQVLAVYRKDEKRVLTQFQWGLVPYWAKEPSIGNKIINARSETVFEKPAFKKAAKSQRCLIVANGFYEWEKLDGLKVPYYIHLASRPLFAFAGLYDHWSSGDGTELATCTILTTSSNESISTIHNRMPVILSQQDERAWLDERAKSKDLMGLFTPYSSKDLTMYEVSTFVNSPKNNSYQCIEKI